MLWWCYVIGNESGCEVKGIQCFIFTTYVKLLFSWFKASSHTCQCFNHLFNVILKSRIFVRNQSTRNPFILIGLNISDGWKTMKRKWQCYHVSFLGHLFIIHPWVDWVQYKKSINNKNPFVFIESIQMVEKKYKEKELMKMWRFIIFSPLVHLFVHSFILTTYTWFETWSKKTFFLFK